MVLTQGIKRMLSVSNCGLADTNAFLFQAPGQYIYILNMSHHIKHNKHYTFIFKFPLITTAESESPELRLPIKIKVAGAARLAPQTSSIPLADFRR